MESGEEKNVKSQPGKLSVTQLASFLLVVSLLSIRATVKPSFKQIPFGGLQTMEAVHSFKGYGKVYLGGEDGEFRRKTWKRLTIIGVSVLLLLVIIGTVIGVVVSRRGSSEDTPQSKTDDVSTSVRTVCAVTRYPESCYSSLMAATAGNKTNDPEELFRVSLLVAKKGFEKIRKVPELLSAGVNNKRIKEALQICTEMIDDSVDSIDDSLALLNSSTGDRLLTKTKIDTLRTYLSAVITDGETCFDGFDELPGDFGEKLRGVFRNSTQFASNSLAIVTKIIGLLQDLGVNLHRKLLSSKSAVPYWVGSDTHRGRLLQSTGNFTPDVVVALDGSGQFRSINESLKLVPKKNDKPFVIYVKAGKYIETVVVEKSMWNVMMIGDSMNRTIVSGSKNVVDGGSTFRSASFIVEGRGFMAIDMGFENTAGPEKHQAVAVRTNGDMLIFYRCSFDAYQDTLYTHTNRQFFRECDIRGTVDFIFGNAAVVFQRCTIRPRQPMANQKNTITAQGRTEPTQNSGISIIDCTISEFDRLTVPTYLGRPWKVYSTTVVMWSKIGEFVDRRGWLSWDGGKSDPPPTIFYAENGNTGPGSNTSDRIKWAGYRPRLDRQEAWKFTLGPFIQANEWIPSRGVAYTL